MSEKAYLALLRGVNVGGKNLIKMSDLKSFLETQGLIDVATYIQSGNVLFRSSERDAAALAARIERGLSKRFEYDSRIVLVPHRRLGEIVNRAPRGFGRQPTKFRYNVIFLREPVTGAEAMRSVRVNPDVDEAHAGRHVLYFSYLVAKASQSRISRIVQLPMYPDMTIRNWNTTTKLLKLLDRM